MSREVYKNVGEISKLFETVMNKKVDNYLNWKNPDNKLYGFREFKSTADVLTTLAYA